MIKRVDDYRSEGTYISNSVTNTEPLTYDKILEAEEVLSESKFLAYIQKRFMCTHEELFELVKKAYPERLIK